MDIESLQQIAGNYHIYNRSIAEIDALITKWLGFVRYVREGV
jgi:hypothetical protein